MQDLIQQFADRFNYDSTTGIMTNIHTGRVCTHINNWGYIQLTWDRGSSGRMRQLAHRIAWFKTNGSIPEGFMIDHINGVKTDNRIENLRLICKSGNMQNSKWKGYRLHKASGKYAAAIKIDGTSKHLGLFTTEREARQAYLEAKKVLHPYASDRVLI